MQFYFFIHFIQVYGCSCIDMFLWSNAFLIENTLNACGSAEQTSKISIFSGYYLNTRLKIIGGFIETTSNNNNCQYSLSNTTIHSNMDTIKQNIDKYYQIIQFHKLSYFSHLFGLTCENDYIINEVTDGSNQKFFESTTLSRVIIVDK